MDKEIYGVIGKSATVGYNTATEGKEEVATRNNLPVRLRWFDWRKQREEGSCWYV